MPLRALTMAILLALSADAGAQGSARVLRVKQLFDQLYFKEALGACDAALEAGRSSRAELVQLLGYKALVAGSLGQEAEAVEAFKRLLTIDPRAKLARGYAPRIRRAYERAAQWVAKHGAIQAAVTAPERVRRGEKLVVEARVTSDPLALAGRGRLYLRVAGGASYSAHASGAGALRWSLPLDALPGLAAATSLELYVALLDESQNEVVLWGSAEAPRRIHLEGGASALLAPLPAPLPAPAPRRRPLLRAWWFWTAVGVAVAATAVGVGVGVGARGGREVVTAPVSLETGP